MCGPELAPRPRRGRQSLTLTTAAQALWGVFGVMGGFMQPQGHLQVVSNMVDLGMDPQQALDAPRFYLAGLGSYTGRATQTAADVASSTVLLEEGIPYEVAEELVGRGHAVKHGVAGQERSVFGRGQVIFRAPDGVLWGGSDPRADGCALGF